MPRRYSFIPPKARKRRSIFLPVNVVEVLEDGHQYVVNHQGQRHEMLSQGAAGLTWQLAEQEFALGRLVGGKVGDQIFHPSIRRPGSAVFLGMMDNESNPRAFWTENIQSKVWLENSVGLPVQVVDDRLGWFEFSPFDRDKAWFSIILSADFQIWYNSGLTTGGAWTKVYDLAQFETDNGLSSRVRGPGMVGIKHDRVADNHLYTVVTGGWSGQTNRNGYFGHSVDGGLTWMWTSYPGDPNNVAGGLFTHSLAPSWKRAGKVAFALLGNGATADPLTQGDEIIITTDDFGASLVVKVYKDFVVSNPLIGMQIAHYGHEDRFHHVDRVQGGPTPWNYHSDDFWSTKTDLGGANSSSVQNMWQGIWAAWDDDAYWVHCGGGDPPLLNDGLVRQLSDGDDGQEEPGWDPGGDWEAVEVNVRRVNKGELICVGLFDSPRGSAYDKTFVHLGAWGAGNFGNAGAINYAGNLADLIRNNVQSGGGSPTVVGIQASIWFDRTEVLLP